MRGHANMAQIRQSRPDSGPALRSEAEGRDLVADPAAEALFVRMYPGVHLPSQEISLRIRCILSDI